MVKTAVLNKKLWMKIADAYNQRDGYTAISNPAGNYAHDPALRLNTPAQAEYLKHSLEQAISSILFTII